MSKAIAVAVALFVALPLYVFGGGFLLMFWAGMMSKHLGVLAPIGYWAAVLLFVMTGALIGVLTVRIGNE